MGVGDEDVADPLVGAEGGEHRVLVHAVGRSRVDDGDLAAAHEERGRALVGEGVGVLADDPADERAELVDPPVLEVPHVPAVLDRCGGHVFLPGRCRKTIRRPGHAKPGRRTVSRVLPLRSLPGVRTSPCGFRMSGLLRTRRQWGSAPSGRPCRAAAADEPGGSRSSAVPEFGNERASFRSEPWACNHRERLRRPPTWPSDSLPRASARCQEMAHPYGRSVPTIAGEPPEGACLGGLQGPASRRELRNDRCSRSTTVWPISR